VGGGAVLGKGLERRGGGRHLEWWRGEGRGRVGGRVEGRYEGAGEVMGVGWREKWRRQ